MGTLKQEKTEPFTSATHILRNCCNELAWKELYDSGQEDEEDNVSCATHGMSTLFLAFSMILDQLQHIDVIAHCIFIRHTPTP